MSTGYSLGTPGGSLADLGGCTAAEAGRDGEVRTAQVLDEMARCGNRVVLHDLSVPDRRIRANIDHLVIGGDVALIVDSKVWRPGFYWTLGDTSYRGLSDFPYAGKQTMRMLQEKLGDALPGIIIRRPAVAVWSSQDGRSVHTFALKVPGANVFPARAMKRRIAALVPDTPPADGLVDRLEPLLRDRPLRRRVSLG